MLYKIVQRNNKYKVWIPVGKLVAQNDFVLSTRDGNVFMSL